MTDRQSLRARRSGILVLPAVIPVAVVVLGGLTMTVVQSFGLLPLVGDPEFSVSAYTQSSELPVASGVSVWIALASTALASSVGFATAILILSGNLGARIVALLGAATVSVPHLVGAASIGLLLSDAGVLPRLLGIAPESWPALVAGPWWLAVILEYAWKESAFVALIIVGTLATRIASYDETASLLGAGRSARLRLVILPLAAPSLIIASTITFVYTLGSYEVAWLLGRNYPEPLTVMALRLFNSASLQARPEAAAVAVVTVLIAAAGIGIALTLARRLGAWR